MSRVSRIVIGSMTAALILAACSSSTTGSTTPTSPAPDTGAATSSDCDSTVDVCVTVKDFSITAEPSEKPAGDVTFDILNTGPSTHEFVVFKSNLDEASFPVTKDEIVDEEGKGLTHIDEVEDILPNTTGTLEIKDMQPGSYVLICNLAGHYGMGMHTAFTVT